MQFPKKHSYWLAFIDFLLVNISFFGMNYFKRDTFELSAMYLKMLLAYYLIILSVSLFFRKYDSVSYKSYFKVILVHSKCALVSLYVVVMFIVFLGLAAFSRLQIIGSFTLFLFLEVVCFTIYYQNLRKKLTSVEKQSFYDFSKWFNISLLLLFNEFLLITFSFLIINYIKNGTFLLSAEYEQILMVIYGLWLFSSIFTRKFDIDNIRNFFYFVSSHLKSFFLMIALMALLVFAFRLFYYSRLHIFGTFFLLLVLETLYNALYFLDRIAFNSNGTVARHENLKKLARNSKLRLNEIHHFLAPQSKSSPSLHHAIKNQDVQHRAELLQFIESQLPLSQLNEDEMQVFNAVRVPPWSGGETSPRLVINTYRVNDIRRINKYFLELHRRIDFGAYFIGRFESLGTYKKHFLKKYPAKIVRPLYYLDFLFTRVFPKLPGIKSIYFLLTRGKNRVISTAELLGRLYYCGFRVIDCKEINGNTYYLAQKAGNPSTDKMPSYGSLIKIEKVGLDGKIIYLRKIRTMHPYSEYLQEYIHQKNNLASNGKFKADFRVAEYGEFFRKYWIDELPQLVNFFRGDISLVGVRALSRHYFSLYPKSVQKLRIKFKPGLIPPYYADLPKSFEEIVESEKRYLLKKQAEPLTTDIKYFCKAVYNVLFKKARSQ